jgi:hypothetical protein
MPKGVFNPGVLNSKELVMQRRLTLAIVAGLLLSLKASAQDEHNARGTGTLERLPRELEIQLALSALPPHPRDKANVYVLNPAKGFEIAREGTNGFHTFVARTGGDAMRGSWTLAEYPTDILYPVSFDAAGAKAHMRVFFDIAEMQAMGTPADDAKTIIQDRYKSGTYTAPERAGVSYMLSPILRTYASPDESSAVQTTNNPHVMHYAPDIANEDIGGTKPGMNPYPFIILNGPHGFTIQHLGKLETAAITRAYQEMLARLCTIKRVWCLPASKGH